MASWHRWRGGQANHADHPSPGTFCHQEFSEGVAEDMGKAIDVDRKVSIGLGELEGRLLTKEWTWLEVGAVEPKHDCPPFGLELIEAMGGGRRTSTEAIDSTMIRAA